MPSLLSLLKTSFFTPPYIRTLSTQYAKAERRGSLPLKAIAAAAQVEWGDRLVILENIENMNGDIRSRSDSKLANVNAFKSAAEDRHSMKPLYGLQSSLLSSSMTLRIFSLSRPKSSLCLTIRLAAVLQFPFVMFSTIPAMLA